MAKKLIMPDVKQCQAEILQGSFMTFGPRAWERCGNKPIWVATEIKLREDGMRGSMSLCNSCYDRMVAQMGMDYAGVETIEQYKVRIKNTKETYILCAYRGQLGAEYVMLVKKSFMDEVSQYAPEKKQQVLSDIFCNNGKHVQLGEIQICTYGWELPVLFVPDDAKV